jgi:hypothetical protein
MLVSFGIRGALERSEAGACPNQEAEDLDTRYEHGMNTFGVALA